MKRVTDHAHRIYDMSFVWPLCWKLLAIVVPQNEIRMNHKMIVAYQSSTTVVCVFTILKMHSAQTPSEGDKKRSGVFFSILTKSRRAHSRMWLSIIFQWIIYMYQRRTSFFHRNRLFVRFSIGFLYSFFFLLVFAIQFVWHAKPIMVMGIDDNDMWRLKFNMFYTSFLIK